MTTQARIYRPAKNAMTLGWGNCKQWVVELEPSARRTTDALTGWVGNSDMSAQLRLKFSSKDEAIAYAERKGYSYRVWEPKSRVVKPKNYADNFAFKRIA